MTLWEFFERLDADPFDPALDALFDKEAARMAENANNTPDGGNDHESH